MSVRRRELELSVERRLADDEPGAGVVRLTARLEPAPDGSGPPRPELQAALGELVRELDALLGPAARTSTPPRAERGLAELVETYRPRQRELIDLLRDEGELTEREHAVLAANLPVPVRTDAPAPRAAPPPPRAEPTAAAERPVPPVPTERGLPAARPVPELLRLYQIGSLRQAGAVRARRQISFAEYMALKRHFESSDTGSAAEERPSDRPG